MEATDNVNFTSPKISLENAYSQINFYSSNKKHKKLVTNGPAQFVGLFQDLAQKQDNQNKQKKLNIQKEDLQEVVMCAQPFFVGEVDHNIEEIGIMAVRQVRYVDDDEWQQIMKQNQKYIQALKDQKLNEIKQIRKIQAMKRMRNQKGQFIPKNNRKNKPKQQTKKPKLQQKKTTRPKKQLCKTKKIDKNNQ